MSIISGYEVSSLKKGLHIVDLLREKRRLNLTEISKAIEVNKTTVFRLLHTLEEMNYIIKVGKDYELHPKLFTTGQASKRTVEWSKMQTLYRLGMVVGKDVFVGTLEGPNVIVRQVYQAKTQQTIDQQTSGPAPAHQTALGKVMLAQLEPTEQLEIFSSRNPTKATNRTFTDPDLFLRHLDVIRQQGYAADYEEFHLGVHCIASPVYCGDKVIASISIADYIDYMPKKNMRSLTRKVIQASQKVTDEIKAFAKL